MTLHRILGTTTATLAVLSLAGLGTAGARERGDREVVGSARPRDQGGRDATRGPATSGRDRSAGIDVARGNENRREAPHTQPGPRVEGRRADRRGDDSRRGGQVDRYRTDGGGRDGRDDRYGRFGRYGSTRGDAWHGARHDHWSDRRHDRRRFDSHFVYVPSWSRPYRPRFYGPGGHLSIFYGVGSGYRYGSFYSGRVYGYAPPAVVYGATRYYGDVRLQVRPRHAQVFVDGYYAGVVDDFDGVFQRLTLEVGPHQIEIDAPGFEPQVFDVYVDPVRTVDVRSDLYPVR